MAVTDWTCFSLWCYSPWQVILSSGARATLIMSTLPCSYWRHCLAYLWPSTSAVATVFEVSGAVTKTIRKVIVDLSQMSVEPVQFVYIMMSALLSVALWLLYATRRGYPVSTTHSIIGVSSAVRLRWAIFSATWIALLRWCSGTRSAWSQYPGSSLLYWVAWSPTRYITTSKNIFWSTTKRQIRS